MKKILKAIKKDIKRVVSFKDPFGLRAGRSLEKEVRSRLGLTGKQLKAKIFGNTSGYSSGAVLNSSRRLSEMM